MYKGKSVSLIIAAGGSGTRMGGNLPKQYLKIAGKTIIRRSVEAFVNTGWFDRVVVACASEYVDYCLKELDGLGVAVVEGGSSRQASIYNALGLIYSDIVLVHDAARPYITKKVIERVIEGACETGACLCGVTPKDTIRNAEKTFDRSTLTSVQTPQGFDTGLLKSAYGYAEATGFTGTDDASLVENIGRKILIVEGDYANIKITTREDLPMETRIGTGYDVHKLVEDRKCILGGVDIPYELGLLGHSDADVLVHAVMDAILGAAGLGDIGRHFPDSDDRYKGISSIRLLEEVGKLVYEEGYAIGNIDSIVICQKPKILPYIEEMRENMAAALSIEKERIGIKGTTTEKLGFEGRGEGIASQAVCTLLR